MNNEFKLNLCPTCGLPADQEYKDMGMIEDVYYVCPIGHSWHSQNLED
jgi:hypothetical protein